MKIGGLNIWCLWPILNVHWSDFVTNDEIRSRTEQPALSNTICSRRLSFFGHLSHADPWHYHCQALDWRQRIGRPRQSHSWLRTIENDLRPLNLGLATAKRRAQDRSAWQLLVTTAASMTSSWMMIMMMMMLVIATHFTCLAVCTVSLMVFAARISDK